MPVRCLPLLILALHGLNAQPCLSLSTAVAGPDGTATLDLSLNQSPESPPASLQWTLRFPSSSIRSLTIDNGPATNAAGKTFMCTRNTSAHTCLVVGGNAHTIAQGVIATVTAVLAADVTTVVIAIENSLGASASGYLIPISSGSGTISRAKVSPDRRLRPPAMRIAGRCSTKQ